MRRIMKATVAVFAAALMASGVAKYVNGGGHVLANDINNSVELLIGSPNAIVDGKIVNIDETDADVVPFIVDERTLVPVRFISESFGMTVYWNGNTSKVTLVNDDYNIELTIGSAEYTVNDESYMLDVPAAIYHERTMLPLRAVSEAIGKSVYYEDGYIYIGDKEYPGNKDINAVKEQIKTGIINEVISNGEYGVRWKLIDDEAADYYLPCERMGDAIGLEARPETPEQEGYSDFDNIYPWSEMKLCSIAKDGTKLYEDAPGFSLTDNDIFVEIPKFYMKRYIEDGYEYRYISANKKDGYYIDPSFVEDGKELDHIYMSAYEGVDVNGALGSASGYLPMIEKTRSQYRELARSKGEGYGLFDIRTLMTIQNLYLIEYADKNSQNAIGQGWGNCLQPLKKRKIILNEENTNRLVTDDYQNYFLQRLFVGSTLHIMDGTKNSVPIYTRKITKLISNEEGENTLSIYFDGDPIDIKTDYYYGQGGQKSGWADAIDYHTGRGVSQGEAGYLEPVKYRNIENLWGNIWSYIDGLNIKDGKIYISYDMKNYNAKSAGYIESSIVPETKTTLDDPKDAIRFMKNLGYDQNAPWLALPVSFVNKDENIMDAKTQDLLNGNFGDYYYFNKPNSALYAHGGGFDHFYRGGLFTLRGWIRENQAWYLYGSRLIYKPITAAK